MSGRKKPKRAAPARKGRRGLTELMQEALRARCDPDTFMYLFGVYEAAASRKMPSKPGAFRPPDEPGKWLVLSDIPINRGMLAVVGELRSIGISETLMQAYMMRIMDFAEV